MDILYALLHRSSYGAPKSEEDTLQQQQQQQQHGIWSQLKTKGRKIVCCQTKETKQSLLDYSFGLATDNIPAFGWKRQ